MEDLEQSAGGIIVRSSLGQLEVVLVEHQGGTYVFPKGHIVDGETPEETAAREIEEETGLYDFDILEPLGDITRPSMRPNGERINKQIHMFLIKLRSESQQENREEIWKWFTFEEALPLFRYQEDEDFLKNIWPYVEEKLGT